MRDVPRSGPVHALAGCAAFQLLAVTSALALQATTTAGPEPPFVVCQDQRYALCAAASCFVYDGVAYCKCDVLEGDSISLQLEITTPTGQRDVCDVNRQGRTNGYMVSTFSLPPNVLKGGTAAVYTCPGAGNAGEGVAAPVAYGQCDGGICFESSSGNRFPGFAEELGRREIVCSCPISTATTPGSTNALGYQVFGPYHPQAPPGRRCDDSGCAACSVPTPAANGSTIPVGAATGVGKLLATKLDGAPPEINECPCACTTGSDGDVTCAVTELPAAPSAAARPCPDPPPCGDDCTNQPFEPTTCWTTEYGPAKADVVVSPENFLYCNGGTYALCFFSGPPQPTGTNPANRPLPCVVRGDEADCTCQAYSSGPYFVDVNAILNLGAYYQTIGACGADGSGCANLASCGPDGRKPGCAERKPAPVCAYVAQQDPDDPAASLIPQADLVSAFSFAMDGDYDVGSTACDQPAPYAGCMTAPCFLPEGARSPPADGDPVWCRCPVYTGVFQVGQDGQACTIPPEGGLEFVWSAANAVGGGTGGD